MPGDVKRCKGSRSATTTVSWKRCTKEKRRTVRSAKRSRKFREGRIWREEQGV